MKLKITKTKKLYDEITINLPYYSKSKNNIKFYKIISETESIEIKLYDFDTSITFFRDMNNLAFFGEMEECSEQDFIEAYNTANKKLKLKLFT